MDFLFVIIALICGIASLASKAKKPPQKAAQKRPADVVPRAAQAVPAAQQMSLLREDDEDEEGDDPCHPYEMPTAPTPPRSDVYSGSMGQAAAQGVDPCHDGMKPEMPTPPRTDVYAGSMAMKETEGVDPCHQAQPSSGPRIAHRMRTFEDSAENTFEVHNPLTDGTELTPDKLRDAVVMSVILQRPCERRRVSYHA